MVLFFLAKSSGSLTSTEVGAFTAIFLMAMAIIRLFGWYLKNRESKKDMSCLMSEDVLIKINKLYDIHCGEQGIGHNGVPRWYVPEDITTSVIEAIQPVIKEEIKAGMQELKKILD